MAISLKHLFQSAKADGPDNTIVQPSDWNDEHVLTQATNRLLGRTTAGAGATEEISAGTGLNLSSGSLSLANTAVSAGSYTKANITVDAQGRITTAANGSISSGEVTTALGYTPVNKAGDTMTGNLTVPMVIQDYAVGFRNRIINGAMEIDQRNVGNYVTPNNSYTLDRWQGANSQTGKFTVVQSGTAPDGFKNSLLVTSSSAYTVGSSEIFALQQKIEGHNCVDFAWGTSAAKTVTLSFWVRSSLTGTFGGSLSSTASSRSYPFSYSVSSANTWEYKTITITGSTSGSWNINTSTGVILTFSLGSGSTYNGTAGAWANSTYYSVSGAVSVVGTNAATFYITGVQLELGTAATPFERRPMSQELAMCQRYYSKSYDQVTKPGVDTVSGLVQTMNGQDGNQIGGPRWKQTMRAAPSLNIWSKNGTASTISTTGYANAANAGSWSGYDVSDDGMRIVVGTGGLTAATAYNFHYAADAEL